MTAPRQQRKQRLIHALALAGAISAVWLGNGPLTAAGVPARVVVNPDSGLAISGFDPVAYFSLGTPSQGRAELELGLGGVVWRFVNDGNRKAFIENPGVYAPQFGGYDPLAIGRDAAVAGHPEIWVISGERLYLFYNEAARTEFLADPARIIERAHQKWPAVSYMIAR